MNRLYVATIVIITFLIQASENLPQQSNNLDVNPTQASTVATTTQQTTPSSLVVGTGPSNTNAAIAAAAVTVLSGSSLTLNPADVYMFQSVNFNSPTTYDSGLSMWQFQANQCLLNVTCPCLSIPPSWNCLESYLKLRTGVFYDLQRYCGGNKPTNFTSDSGQFAVKYKPSSVTTSSFACFVSCTGFGKNAIPLAPINCP